MYICGLRSRYLIDFRRIIKKKTIPLMVQTMEVSVMWKTTLFLFYMKKLRFRNLGEVKCLKTFKVYSNSLLSILYFFPPVKFVKCIVFILCLTTARTSNVFKSSLKILYGLPFSDFYDIGVFAREDAIVNWFYMYNSCPS